MNVELQPCPFCGLHLARSEAFSGRVRSIYVHPISTDEDFRCPAYDYRVADNDQDRIAAWNTRPTQAPQDVAGLVEDDEVAKAEVLRELYTWTGSAFLAGEKMSAAAQLQAKCDLYSFLCGLIGWFMPDEPVRPSPISHETAIPDFLKRQTGEWPPATFPTWGEDDGREGRRLGAEEDPDNNHKALVETLKVLPSAWRLESLVGSSRAEKTAGRRAFTRCADHLERILAALQSPQERKAS